jgi:tubulin monoglycylase TTLL3/8
MWLVKPANLNQGRGIEIFRTLKQILTFLGSKPLNSLWVVQKYIEKPLLYYGRKFDIRVWVIVTGRNEIYFYRKGYIRTSSD